MNTLKCVVCGKKFQSNRNALMCGIECKKIRGKERATEYYHREKEKKKEKRGNQMLLKEIERLKGQVQEFETIGTIEEFKALKENRLTFSIKVSEDTLQKIVHEKIKEYEVNIEYNVKKIRNEVIDDIIKILKKHNVPFHSGANYEILKLKEDDKK